jgi:hypothetical protein
MAVRRKRTTTTRTTTRRRKLNPYAAYVKAHIRSVKGGTPSARMKAVAAMWRAKH